METNSISSPESWRRTSAFDAMAISFLPAPPPSNKVTKVMKVGWSSEKWGLFQSTSAVLHFYCWTQTHRLKIGLKKPATQVGARWRICFPEERWGGNKHASNYCHIKVKHHIKSYGSLFSHRLSSDAPFKDMNSSFNRKCNEFLRECLTTPDILVCRGNNKLPCVSEREGEQIFVPSFIFVL